MIGKTISHYKILEKLGEGGMGVVYKVQDTKLDRMLALKFLPPHLTAIESDKARFIQEAKAASAINHPNVCIIHDIQKHDDQQFIVMEYVEGKTLRETLVTGDSPTLKIKDLIEYALQIATALEAAHNKGVVHRDIKSENIMVSITNQIKVMDFGLAKLKGSLKLTKTSSTVGTLAYMAPEQIEGKPTDARSDIFSFGVVLYEMLTGKLPFNGEYESALMYSILNDDPEPLENYRRDISAELVHVLNRSLEKDPEERYQNMRDVLIDLQRTKRDSSKVSRKSLKEMPAFEVSKEAEEVTTKIKPKRKTVYLVPAVIISILVIIIIGFFIFNPFSEEPLPPMKTTPFTSLPGEESSPTFSPDASQIAFSWFGEKTGFNNDIFVKLIGAGSEQLLVGDPVDDVLPAWSPDGRYIAFARVSEDESGLYIIPARGGTERKLASVNFGLEWWFRNLSWSPDSKSIAFSAKDSIKDFYRIYLLSIDSRQIKELTDGPDLNLSDTYCAISSDGKKLAFTRGDETSTDIYIAALEGGKADRLTFDNSFVWGLSWTSDGSEIVFSSGRGSSPNLWRISATGGEPRVVHVRGNVIRFPCVASQRNLLAYEKSAGDENIWRMEIPTSKSEKNTPSKFIYSTQWERNAKYSPNGKKIAYHSVKSGSFQIWICDSNGENHVRLTKLESITFAKDPNWSPDGRMITFVGNFEGQNEIFTTSVEGGSPFQITKNPANDQLPSYSRDGDWIYFTSDRSGISQIWKIPSQGGEAVPITNNGGFRAYESKDGNWIYYSKNDTLNNINIWKKSLPEGTETLVLQCNMEDHHQWDLAEDGIYFIEWNVINFYDFKTDNTTEIADLGHTWNPELNVSSDQHWILYTQSVEESDIVLVENFR
jgi:serine/threonine protein kinase